MAMCVIHNPTAGRDSSRRRWRRIQKLLGPHATFLASRSPGHAEELAFQAANQGIETLVAAGGDGTVHEVANGLLRSRRIEVCFGVIPLGSGNDYASALGLPAGEEELCRLLLSNGRRHVDVGLVRDDRGRQRFFVNTVGIGLSGAVCYEAKKIKGLRGLPLYGLASIQAILRRFDAYEGPVIIDERNLASTTLYLAVAVGQREGGGFIIAPDAKLDDGWFDYLHAGRLSRRQALGHLPRLVLGKNPGNDPMIRRGQCRHVTMQSSSPMLIHLDGELLTWPKDRVRSVEVWMQPKALAVRTL